MCDMFMRIWGVSNHNFREYILDVSKDHNVNHILNISIS